MNGRKITNKIGFFLQIFEGLKRELSFICLVLYYEIIGKNRLTITKKCVKLFFLHKTSSFQNIFFFYSTQQLFNSANEMDLELPFSFQQHTSLKSINCHTI